MITKTCKVCNNVKSLEEFNKHPQTKDGYISKCKSCEKDYKQKYYSQNKHVKQAWDKSHKAQRNAQKRSDRYKQVRNESRRQRYATDLNYKIHCILRSRLVTALNGAVKDSNTIDYLGCTVEQLKLYLESKFKVGMTWENWTHDVWHVDHIEPLSKFDLTNENQIKEVCHYTNLQPLWAEENLKKSDKVNGHC